MAIYEKYDGCGWHSPKSEEYRQTFSKHLTSLGLNTHRFVDIRAGEKRSNDTIQHYPGDVSGNYGIKAGDGLIIIEIDDHEAGKDAGAFDILPETLSVKGPHGDEFRFFHIEGDVGNAVDRVAGTSEFVALSWGYVWIENAHVLGPGSQLDASGCKKDGCDTCGLAGAGYYEIRHAPEPAITTISTGRLIQAVQAGDALSEYPI